MNQCTWTITNHDWADWPQGSVVNWIPQSGTSVFCTWATCRSAWERTFVSIPWVWTSRLRWWEIVNARPEQVAFNLTHCREHPFEERNVSMLLCRWHNILSDDDTSSPLKPEGKMCPTVDVRYDKGRWLTKSNSSLDTKNMAAELFQGQRPTANARGHSV